MQRLLNPQPTDKIGQVSSSPIATGNQMNQLPELTLLPQIEIKKDKKTKYPEKDKYNIIFNNTMLLKNLSKN